MEELAAEVLLVPVMGGRSLASRMPIFLKAPSVLYSAIVKEALTSKAKNLNKHLYRGENGVNLIDQRIEIIRRNVAAINAIQTPHHLINPNLQNILVTYNNKINELEVLKHEIENENEAVLDDRVLFVDYDEAVLDENAENLERDDDVVRDDDIDFDEYVEDDDVGLIDFIDDNFDIHVEDNFDPDVMLNPSTSIQNVILLEDFVREHNIVIDDAITLTDAGFGVVHGMTLNRDVRMYRPGDIMTKRHCYTMMHQLDPWAYKIGCRGFGIAVVNGEFKIFAHHSYDYEEGVLLSTNIVAFIEVDENQLNYNYEGVLQTFAAYQWQNGCSGFDNGSAMKGRASIYQALYAVQPYEPTTMCMMKKKISVTHLDEGKYLRMRDIHFALAHLHKSADPCFLCYELYKKSQVHPHCHHASGRVPLYPLHITEELILVHDFGQPDFLSRFYIILDAIKHDDDEDFEADDIHRRRVNELQYAEYIRAGSGFTTLSTASDYLVNGNSQIAFANDITRTIVNGAEFWPMVDEEPMKGYFRDVARFFHHLRL